MNLWQDKLSFSQSKIDLDIAKIKSFFPRCKEVIKTDIETDKRGGDYLATLDFGATIYIDAKTREKGARRYWKCGEPEIALEIYSNTENKKLGWTLSASSIAQYILYTFDPFDCEDWYMFPFQLLRKSFYEYGNSWCHKYDTKIQTSDSWHSQAVFVPVSTVLKAINETMSRRTIHE